MAWIFCTSGIELNSEFNTVNNISNICFQTNFDRRFPNDKVTYEDVEKVIVIDGVLLNSAELKAGQSVSTLKEYIEKSKFNDKKIKDLRGPFNGFIYYKASQEICAFGNQTGDTTVFWYYGTEGFAVSSDFNLLYKTCRDNRIHLNFNETAANHILSLGYVVEGNTFAVEIKRTVPGELVRYNANQPVCEKYHLFNNEFSDSKLSLDDAIEKLDDVFRKAVKRCFEKDNEYGYRHIADMSGGLDSRMVNRVALELGYKDILNISYAQSDSNENKYSLGAASAFGNDYIFKPLDNIKFLFDAETIVELNYGLSVYYGITGGKRMLEDIDFGRFGLEHTGMLGDAVVGSFCRTPDDTAIDPVRLCYTDLIEPRLMDCHKYKNHEIFGMYYRGFQGAVMTHYIRRQFTETVSPFMDVDMLQCCFNIPLEYRCGDKLYWAWIDKKYPDISSLPTTHDRPQKVTLSKDKIYHMMSRKFRRKVIRLFKGLGLWRIVSPTGSMNPFEKWYAENAGLREYINKYYNQNIDKIEKYEQIYNDVKKVYAGEKTMDKLSVISLLATYNVYFGQDGINE